MQRIHLDYHASTPIDPAVAAAMRPFLEEQFGNPPSGQWAASGAKGALEETRRQNGLVESPVPDACVLDPDGDMARRRAPRHNSSLFNPVVC